MSQMDSPEYKNSLR